MTCKNCGAKNKSDATYCSDCGSLVDEQQSSEKRKELAKTLVFLITTLVVLFFVIFRIQLDFDNFISYDMPLNLSTEQTQDKLLGEWISIDDTNIFNAAEFKKNNFNMEYTHGDKTMSGTYSIQDSNTMTLDILLISNESIGAPMDIQYKFHFQGEDTLVIVFNGISNVFERKK